MRGAGISIVLLSLYHYWSNNEHAAMFFAHAFSHWALFNILNTFLSGDAVAAYIVMIATSLVIIPHAMFAYLEAVAAIVWILLPLVKHGWPMILVTNHVAAD